MTDSIKSEIWNFDKQTILENKKIGEIPIWWFVKPSLLLNTLPKPFFNLESIETKKQRNKINNTKTEIFSKILRKYILFNEKNKIKIRKKQIINSKEEKLLLLGYSNHVDKNNIQRIKPIVGQLKKENKITPFILIQDLLSNKSSKKINQYENTIYEYINDKTLNLSKKLSKKLNKNIKIKNKKLYEIISNEINFLTSQEILELILMYYFAAIKMIKIQNIKGIVITADTSFLDRAIIAAANKTNIPVICVHHGNPGTVPIEKIDKICLKGRIFKKNLEKSNFKGEMIITGSADYDIVKKYKKENKNSIKKIVISTSPLVEDNFLKKETYFKRINRIIKEINKEKNLEIIINLHPREKQKETYENIAKKYKNVKVIKKIGINFLFKLLNDTDILISFGSFVATDAMTLDKPCIYFDLFGESNPYIKFYNNTEAVIKINKEGEIPNKIKKILTDKKLQKTMKNAREEFIRDYCYKIDGKSKQRITAEIYKTLENGRKNIK